MTTAEVHCSARFCSSDSGGQRLQHGTGHDAAVRNAEAVTEFERGAADDDLLALQLVAASPRRRAARRQRRLSGCRAVRMLKSIRKGASLFAYWPASTARHRGHELAVELLAERIAAHQAVRLDRDIDERRPGMFGELRQRAVDVKVASGRCAGCLKDGSTTDPPAPRSASAKLRSDAGSEGVEKSTSKRDVAARRPSEAAAATRRGAGAARARRRSGRSRARRWRPRRYRRSACARLPGKPQVGEIVAQRTLANRSAATMARIAATRMCGR